MSLISLVRVSVGAVGVKPGTLKMVTTSDLGTITAAGYLNSVGSQLASFDLAPSDVIECLYSYNLSTDSGTYVLLAVSIRNGIITLSSAGGGGGTVNTGLINQAAVYDVAGTTLSGSYQFLDSSSALSVDYNARQAFADDGSTVNLDWSNTTGIQINGILITGAAAAGQVLTATSSSAAHWAAGGGGGGGVNPGTQYQVATYDSGGTTVSGTDILLDTSGILSIDKNNRLLYDETGITVVMDWNYSINGSLYLYANDSSLSIDWAGRVLFDAQNGATMIWGARQLYPTTFNPPPILDWSLPAGVQVIGLQVKEGSNAKQGIATLSSGTKVVSNTSVTANSRIFLTAQETGALTGSLRVSARSVGSSFTILSTVLTDTAVVAWEIFEPTSTL